MMKYLLYILLDWVCENVVMTFSVHILWFLSCHVVFWFWYQDNTDFLEYVGSVPSLCSISFLLLQKKKKKNERRFSGLQQQKNLITVQFWRSKVQNESHWMKTKVLAGLEALGGESISLPFMASGGCLYSLAHSPFFHLQSQDCSIF